MLVTVAFSHRLILGHGMMLDVMVVMMTTMMVKFIGRLKRLGVDEDGGRGNQILAW